MGENACVYTIDSGGIREIVLNQPEKKNAISAEMMDLLRDYLFDAEANPDIRVVILRGEGGVFSSGGDLNQSNPNEVTLESTRTTLQHYIQAIRTLRQISVPVIAQVDRFAVGGAISLMLACDLICVAENAKIIPAFVSLGIAPEMGIMDLLPKAVGPYLAKEILWTNRHLSGQELFELGIANRACGSADLSRITRELAKTIASMPALSVQVVKGIMNSTSDASLQAVLDAETVASPACAQSAEAKAAIAKFAR